MNFSCLGTSLNHVAIKKIGLLYLNHSDTAKSSAGDNLDLGLAGSAKPCCVVSQVYLLKNRSVYHYGCHLKIFHISCIRHAALYLRPHHMHLSIGG
jgi:hypothetical protein